MGYDFISHRLHYKPYSLPMPYYGSIIRLSIVDVDVISDTPVASAVGF